jgi:hypothetical protein
VQPLNTLLEQSGHNLTKLFNKGKSVEHILRIVYNRLCHWVNSELKSNDLPDVKSYLCLIIEGMINDDKASEYPNCRCNWSRHYVIGHRGTSGELRHLNIAI